jgi:hypothetical protein
MLGLGSAGAGPAPPAPPADAGSAVTGPAALLAASRALISGESSEELSESSPSLAGGRTGAVMFPTITCCPFDFATQQQAFLEQHQCFEVLQCGFRLLRILDLAQLAMELQILRLVVLKKL